MKLIPVISKIITAVGISCLSGFSGYCVPEKTYSVCDTVSLEADMKTASGLLEQGDADSALFLFKQVYLESRKHGYAPGVVKSLLETGRIYGNRSDFDAAGKMFYEALGYCRITSPAGWFLPELFFAIGSVYMSGNEYSKTIMYYKAAMNLNGLYGFPLEPALMYHNVALMLRRIGAYDRSMDMVQKGINSLDNKQHTEVYMNLLFSKAILLRLTGKAEESSAVLQELWDRADDHKGNAGKHKFNAYIGWADLEIAGSHPDEAWRYLSLAAAIYGDHILPTHLRQVLYRKGMVQYIRSDYKKAITYFERSLALKETATLFETANIYRMLHRSFAALGLYNQAYTYQSADEALRDSLNKVIRTEMILKLNARYRTQEKDKTLAENQLLIDRQRKAIDMRNAWLGGTLASVTLLALLLVLAGKSYAHRKRLKEEAWQHLTRNRELSEIKAVISGEEKEKARIARELHDGIMVGLSATRMMIDNIVEEHKVVSGEKLNEISDVLIQVSHDLRQTAYNLVPGLLLREGLKKAIHSFCSQVQRSAPFSMSLSLPDQLPRFDSGFELTVYRIVQEVLQNVIKHAHATFVRVSVAYNGESLHIAIEDNGVGMENGNKIQAEGMGLKSIHARMMSVNGNFDVRSMAGHGTGVYLDFFILPVAG